MTAKHLIIIRSICHYMARRTLIVSILALSLTFVGCSRFGGVDSPTGPSSITPKVYMDPAYQTRVKGDEFTAKVYVENVSGLSYAQFDIVYDTSKVALPENNWTEGPFLKKDGITIVLLVGGEQAITGTTVKRTVGITRLSSNPGVSGTGVLCSFTFNASATGDTTIGFDEDPDSWGFMDVNNNPITITVGNGATVNII